MSKIYCYTCNDYSEFFTGGKCEVCGTIHSATGKKPLKSYEDDEDYETQYDGLPHDSDCFWVD